MLADKKNRAEVNALLCRYVTECLEKSGRAAATVSKAVVGHDGLIRDIKKGNVPTADRVKALCAELGIEFYIGPPRNGLTRPDSIVIDAENYDALPLFGSVDAAAGGGAEVADESITGKIAFRSEWLRSRGVYPNNAVMIHVRGDSMEPTINDGDLLLIDTKEKSISSGSVHVFRHDGGLYVKRLTSFSERGVLMSSDNPKYPPLLISASDFTADSVIGRAVWSGGNIA